MKSTNRKRALQLVAAEMVLEKCDFRSAVSIASRKYTVVGNYVSNLYDNCQLRAIAKFEKDVAIYNQTTVRALTWK